MRKIIFLIFSIIIFVNQIYSQMDTIYKKDYSMIIGQVVEIQQAQIKFRPKTHLSGPLRNVSLSEVKKIVYKNGTEEFFDEALPKTNEKVVEQISESKGKKDPLSIEKVKDLLQENSEKNETVKKPKEEEFPIAKENIFMNFVDKRLNKVVIGQRPGITWFDKIKLKDKKGEVFSGLRFSSEKLSQKEGYSQYSSTPYILNVCLDNFFIEEKEKFSHRLLTIAFTIKYELIDFNGKTIFERKVSIYPSYKARQYRKMSKAGMFYPALLEQNYRKLMSETNFEKFIE